MKNAKKSRGSATVEFLLGALVMIALWAITDYVIDKMQEHYESYTQEIAKP